MKAILRLASGNLPAIALALASAAGLSGAAPDAAENAAVSPEGRARYVDSGAGLVLDRLYGLQWQKCSLGHELHEGRCRGTAEALTWKQANLRCLALEWGDHSDWRLPTGAELESLVDPTRARPRLALEYLPSAYPFRFWSSGARNTTAGPLGEAVNFLSGVRYAEVDLDARLPARCVRGPGLALD